MSNHHRKVAVFWDYENCSPPLNSQGHAIVNGIRRIAHVFGNVTSFKTYFDMSSQSSPKSVGFRSDLQSSGVSIIDCPHNGKKEVVDKMILVDMIAFAVDNPSPATIILIAGDRDYAYAVSTLRLRQYTVVLIVPPAPNIPQSLESQASVVVDWNFAILGKRTEADTLPNAAPSAVPSSPVSSRGRNDDITAPNSTHFDPTSAMLDNRIVESDEAALLDAFGYSNEDGDDTSSNDEFDASTGSPIFSRVDDPLRTQVASSPSVSLPTPAPSVIPISPTSSSAPSPSTPSSLTLTVSDSDASTPYVDVGLQQATSVINDDKDNHSSGRQAPLTESMKDAIRLITPPQFLPLIDLLLLAMSKGETKSSRSTIAVDLVKSDKNAYKRAGVTRFSHYTALAEQASLVKLTARDGATWIALHPNLFRQNIDSDPESSYTPSTVHINDSPTPPDNITYNKTPAPSSAATPPPTAASPLTTRTSALNPNASPFMTVVPIPLCFQPLVACLAKVHRNGIAEPLRSAVGQVLGFKVYSQAGAASLKEYIAQAMDAGVVECGGGNGYDWVKLHPDVRSGKRSC
ncbi:NYN domain-containing protein [Suillus clintonianus]|uniref:NYN domain-containing protein n=1 Tax=Suillus clintonianus TaxID=1904413 RepID=UPI001B86B04B|nr:NYN domain-containing protein [Suillus clintonianus]KAG2112856.1 NYN domain-containing protein [Suillus clintonianus]